MPFFTLIIACHFFEISSTQFRRLVVFSVDFMLYLTYYFIDISFLILDQKDCLKKTEYRGVTMSEELTKDITVNEEPVETMADYEDHFDDANPWNIVKKYWNEGTTLTVKIEGIVNGGAIAMIEGIRGFIPASRLSLSYVEDLETYLLQEIDVRVIDVDQKENRLVLSAREILKEKARAEKEKLVSNMEVGAVLEGTVESLQSYGAFLKLENGLSGLVHISQISNKRVKAPSDVLHVGDTVQVKIIGIKDGKLSLSMKALEEKEEEEVIEEVEIPVAEEIGTNLGDLFKNIKL